MRIAHLSFLVLCIVTLVGLHPDRASAQAQILAKDQLEAVEAEGVSTMIDLNQLTKDEINALLARLSDTEIRNMLLTQLSSHAVSEETEDMRDWFHFVEIVLTSVDEKIQLSITQFNWLLFGVEDELGKFPAKVMGLTEGGDSGTLVLFAIQIAVVLTIAFGGQLFISKILRKGRELRLPPEQAGFMTLLGYSLIQAGMKALNLVIFLGLAAVLSGIILSDASVSREAMRAILIGISFAWAFSIFATLVFSPSRPQLRLSDMSDDQVDYIHFWLNLSVKFGALSWINMQLFELMDLGAELLFLNRIVFGSIIFFLLIFACLYGRNLFASSPEKNILPKSQFSFLSRFLKKNGMIVLSIYLGLAWAIWLTDLLTDGSVARVNASIITAFLIMLMPSLDMMCKAMVQRAVDRPMDDDKKVTVLPPQDLDDHDEGDEILDPEAAMAEEIQELSDAQIQYRRAVQDSRIQISAVLHQAARLVVVLGMGLVVLEIWSIPAWSHLYGAQSTAFSRGVADVFVAVMIANFLWQLLKASLDPYIPKKSPIQALDDDNRKPAENARALTLLPLLRKTLMILLSVVVIMIILSSLGMDIGPLLASAGVVGIAIGFGAQALVRDVVSGIFFLVDDAFRIGEYVDIGVVKGEVEAVSLRSMRLRHHRGAVHTIPFGELQAITNYSRDWCIMKMEFRVPFDSDIEKIRKTIKKVGLAMLEDPKYTGQFLGPLKSQGVHRTEENAFIIRTKFTCKPGDQWIIRRDAYRAITDAFKANNIKLAPRTVSVEGHDGGDVPAAAMAAIQAQEAAQTPSSGEMR